ncbi:MAG: Maf family protein [Planctomycetaceae bacterium]
MAVQNTIVLGSRSPRRLELLRLIAPCDRIAVVPPRTTAEAGFKEDRDWPAIERRLFAVARAKCDDVVEQCDPATTSAVIAADTVIVVEEESGDLAVLGQPPDDDWRQVVRDWFRRYLLGRCHTAATAVCIAVGKQHVQQIERTRVRFGACSEEVVDWYIATGEPRGKAGGYAVQGAGEMFVSEIHGSLSNVVGLPLRRVRDALWELGVVERV